MIHPRLFIIDGPDGAGKTTLASNLAQHLMATKAFERVSFIHHGAYPGEDKIASRYFIPMAQTLQDRSSALIMDRSWLAEPIYDDFFKRGGSRIGTAERRMLERVAHGLDAATILALPPLEVCLANRQGSGDSAAMIAATHAAFTSLAARRHDISVYDYANDSWRSVLAGTALPGWRGLNTGPGIGVFSERSALLVGDRPNSAKHGDLKHRAPFISFGGRTGCSHWLAEQLEEAGINEDRLYWINAYDCSGSPTSAEFIGVMQPRVIIALGDQALKWCEMQSRERPFNAFERVVHVKHPQHWKRFHHNERYPLGEIIKEYLV